jgi:predicted RNA methylase
MQKKAISEPVLNAIRTGLLGGHVFRLVLEKRLNTDEYRELRTIFQTIGGKWSSAENGFTFTKDPVRFIADAIATGEYLHPRDYGYFPTPDSFAKALVEKADIHPGMSVLEPSAGRGAIAQHAAMYVGFSGVTLVELLDCNIEVLRQTFPQAVQGDFLKMIPNLISQFDRIVMNPPFHRHIAHVRHAWRFLKPGGRLVSVMAAGVADSANLMSQRFREFAEKHGTIERNPAGSFKESGTMVETVTVILNKP